MNETAQGELPATLPTLREADETIEALAETLEALEVRRTDAQALCRKLGAEVRDTDRTLKKWLTLRRKVVRAAKQLALVLGTGGAGGP